MDQTALDQLGAEERLVVRFSVLGRARPAGSKNAYPLKHRDGSYVTRANGDIAINVTDSGGKPLKDWMRDVGLEAQNARNRAGEWVQKGPLRVEFVFYRPWNLEHYVSRSRSRPLRPDAPRHPAVQPDVLKLARAVEDALTDVLWADDAQIVDERIEKKYGEPERVEISVWALT